MHGSRRLRFTGSTIAAVSVLTLASATTASALTIAAPAPQPTKVSGGTTTVTPAASVKRARLAVTATGKATRSGSAARVPISTGTLGLPGKASVLDHDTASGLKITGPSGSVTVTDLQVKAGKKALVRASFNGAKRQLLFQLKITKLYVNRDGTAGRSKASVRLTANAAKALRKATGAKKLRAGRFGTIAIATSVATGATPGPYPTPLPIPLPVPVPTPPAPIEVPANLETSSLSWTQVNAYTPGATVDSTWLGYFTNPIPGQGNGGSFTPSDGATGDTVTPASARGAATSYRVSFPATSTTAGAASKTGVVRFKGLVTFASPMPPAGHGIKVSLQDPRVEFDGTNTAKLYATGTRTPGTPGVHEPYDDQTPVFTLDLGSAAPTDNGDGTVSFENVTPSIALTGHAFPGNYPTGAGPDRTPNTFGSFTIRMPKTPSFLVTPAIP